MSLLRKPCYILCCSVSLLACTSGNGSNTTSPTTSGNVTKPATAKTEPANTTASAFMINGTASIPGTRSDQEISAQINAVNDNLSIFVYGDIVPGNWPGMLQISCKPFTKTTGDITIAKATYTRYLDDHGGKTLVYGSNKDGSFALHISKCEHLPDGPVGEEWLISGTFSGTLPVSTYQANEATDPELAFSNGHFEDIKVIVLGKKK